MLDLNTSYLLSNGILDYVDDLNFLKPKIPILLKCIEKNAEFHYEYYENLKIELLNIE